MFPFPKLLTHPNIPKPLHGLNPRTILGDSWWDTVRRKAYAKYEYRCWACGIHKIDARYFKWLEGHESYTIDYTKGSVKLKEIVALCHSCHNFIHSGRMYNLFISGEFPEIKIKSILLHGIQVLSKNNLEIFDGTAYVYESVFGARLKKVAIAQVPTDVADWNKWHLILNGKKYYSKFKSYSEWSEFYG